MAKAKLVAKDKFELANGCRVELVVWELPEKTRDRPHGYKYRLYYGDNEGNCIVRYDNETGKGDHKHIGNKELPYCFVNIDTLFSDFEYDINQAIQKHRGKYE